MSRSSFTRTLNGLERFLLISGLCFVCVYGVVRLYSVVYSHEIVLEFWRNRAVNSGQSASAFRPHLGIPDFRFWSPKRVEAYQASLAAEIAAPLAVLRIPSVGIEVPVLEGTDDLTLNRAVGHIAGTPIPGEKGNIGIAGHRDGFFRGLKDIQLGDFLDLYTEKASIRYVVEDINVVRPEDVSVLGPRPGPSITLVTCYPFYFVGNAPLRYIVHASAVDAASLKAPGRSSSSQEEEAEAGSGVGSRTVYLGSRRHQ